VIVTAGVLVASTATAQSAPSARQIGRLERVSSEPLGSVTSALALSNGSVLVNDTQWRRVLLFDSTLSHVKVLADTTVATANAYGAFPGTLIRFREDSALFIDQSTLSMLVLAPSGAIARVMAVPRPRDQPGLFGGPFGTPGVDPRGRLVYFVGETANNILIIRRGSRLRGTSATYPNGMPENVDSGFIARVDLASRAVDTVAAINTPKQRRLIKVDDRGFITAIETTIIPLALIDDWAMLRDGTIAVVRGRDYHVDWLGDGHKSSSAKIAFGWQRIDDARKQTLIDSSAAAFQSHLAEVVAGAGRGAVPGGGRGAGGGRAGAGLPAGRGPPAETVPNVVKRASLDEVPDYWPAFERGSVSPDIDGNLWIRTTAMVAGRPVYDVVNRKGELVDRVQLPSFRTIAGFGPGVVYMAVKDEAGIVHLERARVK
jgi:hypothetical protein